MTQKKNGVIISLKEYGHRRTVHRSVGEQNLFCGRLSEKMSGEPGYCNQAIIGNFYFSGGFMKKAEITLVPLKEFDREQFILDNQWAFKHGALLEFGERDGHIDSDGEIISRKTIETCLDLESAEAYRIVFEGKNAGGIILQIDKETNRNELDILFVLPEFHSKGIGYGAWLAAEKLHPETKIWETCTPYFDKRNIHLYVNKCGFVIDQFWCKFFKPDHEIPDGATEDEGPDEMFRFIKVMKS